MMNWKQLLSLKKHGDEHIRNRKDEKDSRVGFEVDYDRIIFSNAFRSLQDKTQVIPLSKTDFVHTRLTHSLEVSVVGRSLGRLVGEQVLDKHEDLKELGYTINDFGAIVSLIAFGCSYISFSIKSAYFPFSAEAIPHSILFVFLSILFNSLS